MRYAVDTAAADELSVDKPVVLSPAVVRSINIAGLTNALGQTKDGSHSFFIILSFFHDCFFPLLIITLLFQRVSKSR